MILKIDMAVKGPPLTFKVVAWLRRKNIRGAGRLRLLLAHFGMLQGNADFPCPDGRAIRMPLDWPRLHRPDLFQTYESGAIAHFAAAIDALPAEPVLVDGGADVGVFTRLVLSHTTRIKCVCAVEPNTRAVSLLHHNLSRIGIKTMVIEGALADRKGFGRLERPPYNDHDRARFLNISDVGEIPVTSVDALGLIGERTVALKLDLEGGEGLALSGARKTLAAAEAFVVQLEAHPDVASRTGIDPVEWLILLNNIRPICATAFVEATGEIFAIQSLDRPIFEQLPRDRIYDIVVETKPNDF